MHESIDLILEDDTGTELSRFAIRALVCTALIAISAMAGFWYAAAEAVPLEGLEGASFVILNGAHAPYWAPILAGTVTYLLIAAFFGKPLSSGWYILLLCSLAMFQLFEGVMVQKTTNYVVAKHAEAGGLQYHPCVRLGWYYRSHFGVRGPPEDRTLVYEGEYDYVYTRSLELCEGLKQNLRPERTDLRPYYTDLEWGNSTSYRKSIDPEQKQWSPRF